MGYKEELIKELEVLLSGKTLRTLTKVPKKCYKYVLTAVFINICFGRQLTKGQEENFNWVYSIKRVPKAFEDPKKLYHIQKTVEVSLNNSAFYNYNEYETINKIIEFFRNMVAEIKKNGTYLVKINDVQSLFDIKKMFDGSHNNVQPHHWIDIDLITGMVITVPEYYTYVDVVNSWNILVDKLEEYESVMSNNSIPIIERRNNIDNRRIKYEIDTLLRTLSISSVTFVESYLYYLFYNLKEMNYQPKSGLSIKSIQKVEDEEIIKKLLIPEFIGKNKYFEELFKKYKKLNKIRNRFIHISAFQDASESSEMLPLVTMKFHQVVDTLETCTQLVKLVDGLLPEEYKILIWWDRVTHPNFNNKKKGDITNPNSLLSKIKYIEN